MPDAVVGPAQVGVRDLDAVPEVELDAGLQRVPLRTGGETRPLTVTATTGAAYFSHTSEKRPAQKCSGPRRPAKTCQEHSGGECEWKETEKGLWSLKGTTTTTEQRPATEANFQRSFMLRSFERISIKARLQLHFLTHLIQVKHEGNVAPDGGAQLPVTGDQPEASRRPGPARLPPGREHLPASFFTVIGQNSAIASESRITKVNTPKTREAAGGGGKGPDGFHHSPCAVEEALAGAAAFSHAIGIKPEGRRAVSIRLAFPPVIAAQIQGRSRTSYKFKHDHSNQPQNELL